MGITTLYIAIVALTALTMEFVAWSAHKFLMHGPLWSWHADHHKPHFEKEGFFERNDLFFVVFAVPSALSYMIGSMYQVGWLFCIGIGISVYGLIYFIVHDVYIPPTVQVVRWTGWLVYPWDNEGSRCTSCGDHKRIWGELWLAAGKARLFPVKAVEKAVRATLATLALTTKGHYSVMLQWPFGYA